MSEPSDAGRNVACVCAGGNVYWTDDSLGRVSVARLGAGDVRRTLVHEWDPTYNPRSIAVDPTNG